MNKYLLISSVVVATWLVGANAFGTILSKLPNGFNVPNPCGTGTWPAFGHDHPTIPIGRNSFGVDFKNNFNETADYINYKVLCWLDSDGDKKWNGYELGDPYCNGTAIPGMPVTNPGVCEPVNSALCVRRNRPHFTMCPQVADPNVADPIGPNITDYKGNTGGNNGGSTGNGGSNGNGGTNGNGGSNGSGGSNGNSGSNGNGGGNTGGSQSSESFSSESNSASNEKR